jgi:DNA-binding NarL/FixJ family response regulator
MPGKNGIDVLRVMDAEHLDCRTVLLTATARDSEVADAVKLGARGLVFKESQPEDLLECVRAVYRGEVRIDSSALRRAAEDPTPPPHVDPSTLTPRELEIVRMVAQGMRNKAISEKLSITEGTVKVHLHNIYEKLHVDGRLELVLTAQERRLI